MPFITFVVPPSFINVPSDKTVTESDETTFYCKATGNPTPKITWIKDGKTVSSGDTFKFVANRNDSGQYWCTAENGLNVVINVSASLDVQCKLKKYFICGLNHGYPKLWCEHRYCVTVD